MERTFLLLSYLKMPHLAQNDGLSAVLQSRKPQREGRFHTRWHREDGDVGTLR